MTQTGRGICAGLAALVLVAAPAAADPTRPSAQPSRIVLAPTGTPSTSHAVTWRTDAATETGKVELQPVAGGSTRTIDAMPGAPLSFEGWDYQSRHHSAVLGGLEPGSTYRYRVGSEGRWSRRHEFTTPRTDGAPWTMLYFGDAQNDLRAKWTPVVQRAFAATPDVALHLHAGDLINTASNDDEWQAWFDALGHHAAEHATVATPGNHELSGDATLSQYSEHFTHPDNGPTNHKEWAYYTDFGGVRFVSLNSNTSWDNPLGTLEQVAWLDQVLGSNPNRWSVVTFHHPLYSASEGRDNPHLRTLWQPVLEEHDVDLVLQGHDHAYSRGHVTDNETGPDGENTGPVYVVSVSGPKYYELTPEDKNNWTDNGATRVAAFQQTSTFQQIRVEQGALRYRSIVAAKGPESSTTKQLGETVDAFTVTKDADGSKLVTEGATFPDPRDADVGADPRPETHQPSGVHSHGQSPPHTHTAPAAGASSSAQRATVVRPGHLRWLRTTRSARSGLLMLRIAVPSRGSVRATATAGGVTIARGSRAATRAGRLTVRLGLTHSGLRRLRKARRLRVAVRLTHRPSGGEPPRVIQRRVVLRLPQRRALR